MFKMIETHCHQILKYLALLCVFSLFSACNSGCIQADSFGNITLKSIKLEANPYGQFGLISNFIPKCKPGCETSGGNCTSYNYWKSLSEQYNSSKTYNLNVRGNVRFCSVSDEQTLALPDNPLINLVARTEDFLTKINYQTDQEILRWVDDSPNGNHGIQDNIVPTATCDGKTVTLNGKNLVKGNYANLGVDNELVTELNVAPGCKMVFYDKENFTGWNYVVSKGSINLTTTYVPGNETCHATETILYHTQNKGAGNPSQITVFSPSGIDLSNITQPYNNCVEGGLHKMGIVQANDTEYRFIYKVDTGRGCRIVLQYVARVSQGYVCYYVGETFESGQNGDVQNTTNFSPGFIIEKHPSPIWQKNVSSLKVLDDAIPSPSYGLGSLTPRLKRNIFSNSSALPYPALKFDGVNDFYRINSASNLFSTNYATFSVVKEAAGTIFAANDSSGNLLEKLSISGNKLHYSFKPGTSVQKSWVSPANISSPALITLIKRNGNVIINENGKEIGRINSVGYGSNISTATLGVAMKPNFVPEDFMSGYMAAFKGFDRNLSDLEVAAMDARMMETYGISTCSLDQHLDRIRLKMGEEEPDVEIFANSDSGFPTFEIPSAFTQRKGNMFFRLSDPEADLGCLSDAVKKPFLIDNRGTLELSVKITRSASFIGSLYKFFVLPIENYIIGTGGDDGIQKRFFDGVMGTGKLLPLIMKISLLMYVSFFAISFLMGIEKLEKMDFIMRLFKMGIILSLLSDSSWEFFSTYIITFFREGSVDMIGGILGVVNQETGLLSGAATPIETLFQSLDNLLGMFMSKDIQGKIMGLWFSPPLIGFLTAYILYISFYIFVHITIKIVIIYVSIFIMMTFAFIVAPVFLIFMLFKQTSSLFNKWLDLIIGYFVQYIFFAAIVAIFTWIIYAFFINMMGYTVCWKTILYCCPIGPINFPLLDFYAPSGYDYRRFNLDIKTNYVPDIWTALLFLFMTSLFRMFLDFATDVAASIAGGVKTSDLSSAISKATGTDDIGRSMVKIGGVIDKGLGKAGNIGRLFGKGNIYDKAKSKVGAFGMGTRSYKNKQAGQHKKSAASMAAIKSGIAEGNKDSMLEGTDRDAAIRSAVRKNLDKQSEGYSGQEGMSLSNADIDKIMNSRGMQNASNRKLQTKDVRNAMREKYNSMIKDGASKADVAKELENMQTNVGSMLREEMGHENANTSKLGSLKSSATRNDAMSRYNNMVRMSADVEKEMLRNYDAISGDGRGYLGNKEENIIKKIKTTERFVKKFGTGDVDDGSYDEIKARFNVTDIYVDEHGNETHRTTHEEED